MEGAYRKGPTLTVEGLSQHWQGAVVLVYRSGMPEPIQRAAVFLFDLPGGGFVWVEPHAWDPFGPSSPASHARPHATWSPMYAENPAKGFNYEDPETGENGLVFPWVRRERTRVRELEAFYDEDVAGGLDVVAERQRIRAILTCPVQRST